MGGMLNGFPRCVYIETTSVGENRVPRKKKKKLPQLLLWIETRITLWCTYFKTAVNL
jgi:hypothetical protein